MMNSVLATLAAATALAVPAPVASTSLGPLSEPPPDPITVQLVSINGSGCPTGSTVVAPFEGNTGFTVTYDQSYIAQAGLNVSPVENRKNCQLGVSARVPQGFTYAISTVSYRGYIQLDAGGRATQQASFYFAGQPGTARVSKDFSGPMADNWQVDHQVASLVYAPCTTTRNININSELRVFTSTPQSPVSYMNMDSTDVDVSTVFRFTWRHC